jgi:hypothetical protein
VNVDKFGLPVNIDPETGLPDPNDQLQRVGMLAAASELGASGIAEDNFHIYSRALFTDLQPTPGIYTRYRGAPTNNVSADQLISPLCFWVAISTCKAAGKDARKQILWMLLRCLARLGFAQNYKDGLGADSKTKIPDFMLARALPLFVRASRLLYPLALAADLLLVVLALAAVGPVWGDGKGFRRRGPDDVDDNNTILTLMVCCNVQSDASFEAGLADFPKFPPVEPRLSRAADRQNRSCLHR